MSDGPIAIAVPVRNEAARLPRFLQALARQRGTPPFTLALFFDSCDDGSAALVAATPLPFPIFTDCCDAGFLPNAGRARRRATALAAAAAPGGVLLTTDADGEPSTDWIAANLRGLACADVVAGRIVREPGRAAPVQDRLERYYDRLHALRRRLDPVPHEAAHTHHWSSAASLALRTVDYDRLGGFPEHASGEDAALLDAAARTGLRVRRDADVRVMTSARRVGRAPHGFAATLADLDRAAAMPVVTHPADEAWRFAQQGEARRLHGADALHLLAAALRLPLAEVEQVAAECPNGEAFAARIVGAPPGGMRSVPLAQAEMLLGALELPLLDGVA